MKSHFTNRKYDFFRYGGKSRATMTSFNKRKDKYWFEKTSRKYSDEQIVDFLLANFVTTDNPKNLCGLDKKTTEYFLLIQRRIK